MILSVYTRDNLNTLNCQNCSGDWRIAKKKEPYLTAINIYSMHNNYMLTAHIIAVSRTRVLNSHLELKWRYKFYFNNGIIIQHNNNLSHFKKGNPISYN